MLGVVLGVVLALVVGEVLGEVVGEVATQSRVVTWPIMGWSTLRVATPPRQSVRRMHTAVCAAARWPSMPMGSASYANAYLLSQARHWPAPASQVNGHSAQPDVHAHAAPVLVTPSKQATLVGVVVRVVLAVLVGVVVRLVVGVVVSVVVELVVGVVVSVVLVVGVVVGDVATQSRVMMSPAWSVETHRSVRAPVHSSAGMQSVVSRQPK